MTKETPLAAVQPIESAPVEPAIPEQKEFYRIPARFGSVPIDEAPLGWELETRRRENKITKFEHVYPRIALPFQEVNRVEFGHANQFKPTALLPSGTNRLFFGDNLHVMRQLPSNSIDVIYLDPPFFSGRNYNVLFGDKNEIRSFSDIWEGGMPGYLIWLNARLYEMKRLLKRSGSIFVHLDWHAVHYVKVEMDKIFGVDNFRNEIIWHYKFRMMDSDRSFNRKHDTILWYAMSDETRLHMDSVKEPWTRDEIIATRKQAIYKDESGREWIWMPGGKGHSKNKKKYLDEIIDEGKALDDVWDMPTITSSAKERIGYPTQKPEALLERIVKASSVEGDVVADFFCGGGTTPAVAQRLNRRWIASDQSRIAVAITADRVSRTVEEKIGKVFAVPDFTVEHWGIYEVPRLETLPEDMFREFVVRAFGGRTERVSPAIHGVRHGVPLHVGPPSRTARIGKDDVAKFAKAIFEERRSNAGTMLGWNFGPDAKKAAEILAARENKRIDFVRLSLVRLESDEFREHVVAKHKDYGQLLSFIQPPEVVIHVRRVSSLKYEFDVSESVSMNKEGVVANVQWDFEYNGKFTSTQGYSFLRDTKTGRPVLVVEYKFSRAGTKEVACSVQDDQGGERTEVLTLDVK